MGAGYHDWRRLEESRVVSTFEYRRAESVSEAVELLRQAGDDAKILAGGQSLLALVNLGLAQPSVLIDINPVREMDYIEQRDGALAIGAVARHVTVERSDVVRRACPLLAETMPLIGDRQVRNRGTVGGSIAHADPVAELPTVAVCLDAVMKVQGPSGQREVPASDFFVTYLTTGLQPDEVLTEVRFPAIASGTGSAFQELVRRKGDFAIVAAAATVQVGADGQCREAHLALAGVAPTPIRARAAEEMLVGQAPTPELLREAARAASANIEPQSDVMASAEYRRAMAEVYARRTLAQALERAGARGAR